MASRRIGARMASRRAGMILALTTAIVLAGSSPTTAAADPLIAAAGDIACDDDSPYFNRGWGRPGLCRQRATSRLLDGAHTVLPLGDLQYEHGTLYNFRHSYKHSWGRYKSSTRPVIGNHEYGTYERPRTDRAQGYWRYWGSRAGPRGRGWYSFDIGRWHVVALNSVCWAANGCGRNSPQVRWLKRDLARHRKTKCILAAWHHPNFSSGQSRGYENELDAFWETLQTVRADVVLAGHDHVYERFSRQNSEGGRWSRGPRQFMVGTGGKNIGKFVTRQSNSVVRRREHGVLRMRLRRGSYEWRFAGTRNQTLDRGRAGCV